MTNTANQTLLGIGGVLILVWSVAEAQTTVRMEAEDMQLDTYRIEVLDFASGGALINLKGDGFVGAATAPFPGVGGEYDIIVVYHDENDGLAQLSVSINDREVGHWTLDERIKGGEQPIEANRFTRKIATGYTVATGDEITINGLQGNWDHANVDYIEFTPNIPDDATSLLANGSFEEGEYSSASDPMGWGKDSWKPANMQWDNSRSRTGNNSVKIDAATPNDARWQQTVDVLPGTVYFLSGWIKTEDVAHGEGSVVAGANVSLFGTWQRSAGVFGTSDWTRNGLLFNSQDQGQVTVAARLGYWSGIASGTAWFDDLKLEQIMPMNPHPSWKILVLIFRDTDLEVTDGDGVKHHYVASMTREEAQRAATAARQFVTVDIPALTSGNMVPEVMVRFPDHALTDLSPLGEGWWPSPGDTATDRDPDFDSVIVIWDTRATDLETGEAVWIGSADGRAMDMGGTQTYLTMQIDAAINRGHRNVFKHEWGHSILFFYQAIGASPQPSVDNHAHATQYVNCRTGQYYVWQDESSDQPIPNSTYNNESGFTHDYYSGETATADEPTRCLGVPSDAWALGGPVSHSGNIDHPRIEAEDMRLDGYRVEALDFASGGALINLKGPGFVGSATLPFAGATGLYDIVVVYHDENDGLAQLNLSINDREVDSWTLDERVKGGEQPIEANRFTRQVATGYTVKNGDEIAIYGLQSNWDHANVDYIEFVLTQPLPPASRIEAEDMQLDGYRMEALDFSSGGALIDLKGPAANGSATLAFPGDTGQYDILVVYHDENDGVAQLSVSIAGVSVDSWILDKKIRDGEQPQEYNRFTRQIATDYTVKSGDEIRIDGLQGNWDHANVDYIEFAAVP
jgi:hypothetical protein